MISALLLCPFAILAGGEPTEHTVPSTYFKSDGRIGPQEEQRLHNIVNCSSAESCANEAAIACDAAHSECNSYGISPQWHGSAAAQLYRTDFGSSYANSDWMLYSRSAPPAPPTPPACSFNGVLDASGECICDDGWVGSRCSRLDIAPQPNNYKAAYGYDPNVTSWGGNAILGDDGQWHLFVSEIPDGLKAWKTKSQIIHAVADDPMDVFRKVGTPFPSQAHNAAPIRAPASHAACPGCWYLFHIGSSNSTSGFAHRATAPEGPWSAVPSPFGCNNPAPAFANNGTLFVVCNSLHVYRAGKDPLDKADWTKITDIDEGGWKDGKYLKVEDAFLWQNTRGQWHLMTHRYDYRDGYPQNPDQTMPVLVAGHAYSPDLRTWFLNDEPPFDSQISFENGDVQYFATMERPHLIFNDQGVATHSVHAVSPIWDQFGAPCNVCDARPGSAHSCVVCKTSEGYDWTYTVVQRLRSRAHAYVPDLAVV